MKNTINHLLFAFAFVGILFGASAVASNDEINKYVLITNNTKNNITYEVEARVISSNGYSFIEGRGNIVKAGETNSVKYSDSYRISTISFPDYKQKLVGTKQAAKASYAIPEESANENWQITITKADTGKIQACGAHSDVLMISSDHIELGTAEESKCAVYIK